MKIEESSRSHDWVISFQSDDWKNTCARRGIEIIKTYAKDKYWYSGITKKWTITECPEAKEKLKELFDEFDLRKRVSYDENQPFDFMLQFED